MTVCWLPGGYLRFILMQPDGTRKTYATEWISECSALTRLCLLLLPLDCAIGEVGEYPAQQINAR